MASCGLSPVELEVLLSLEPFVTHLVNVPYPSPSESLVKSHHLCIWFLDLENYTPNTRNKIMVVTLGIFNANLQLENHHSIIFLGIYT